MPKQPENLQKHRASKDGKLNTSQFNFLENLLVFRTLEKLSVPGGKRCQIQYQSSRRGAWICLLIHIDNQRFPVVAANVPRPDYLALYFHGSGCICTIIEMKSRDNKKLEHGLEQIKSLADTLKNRICSSSASSFPSHCSGGFAVSQQCTSAEPANHENGPRRSYDLSGSLRPPRGTLLVHLEEEHADRSLCEQPTA